MVCVAEEGRAYAPLTDPIEGLVESSSNLGVINATADGIEIRQMPRSSSPQRLDEIEDQYRALAAENGLAIDITEGSRPWPVNEDSAIVPRIRQIYREQNAEEIEVVALHAGLECGVFYELVDGLDMASIGPDDTPNTWGRFSFHIFRWGNVKGEPSPFHTFFVFLGLEIYGCLCYDIRKDNIGIM